MSRTRREEFEVVNNKDMMAMKRVEKSKKARRRWRGHDMGSEDVNKMGLVFNGWVQVVKSV